MYEPNVERVLALLRPDDVVLDIGGWASPFNRATHVMDAFPYESRGFYRTFGGRPYQGGEREHFTPERWIQRDICDREPYPFADKSVDFAICSHTLEDIRDPLWVCQEMIRIAKRGYIEVPSHLFEITRGVEHPRIAGLSHHRWVIDITDGGIRFVMKSHSLHTHWRFSLPKSYLDGQRPERGVQWLFWTERFDYREDLILGHDEQVRELERFVTSERPYAAVRLAADHGVRSALQLGGRLVRGLARMARRRVARST